MVLSHQELRYFSPIRTSANGTRQIEFDKEDINELGIVKLDILGLRMLSTISEARERLDLDRDIQLDVDNLPPQDEPTYELIRSGRTLGLFQIESPGQMRLLADTQPRNFRDLVVQVALFRPGPLQGDMVRPYIRHRRSGEETPPLHPSLGLILQDTHGQVIFQEQVLEIVHQFAGFTLMESDKIRRVMSRFRVWDEMESMRQPFIERAVQHHKGSTHPVSPQLANQVFELIRPFVGYGFCRSHAVVFAHTVYQSAYLKRHYPAAHFCGVLQHHPGFYPAQTLVQEARACGVTILPVDVRYSDIQYRLEKLPSGGGGEEEFGIRLPLSVVKNLSETGAGEIVWERFNKPFASLEDLYLRVRLDANEWDSLARSGALTAFGQRRDVLWELGLLRRRVSQEDAGQQVLDFPLVTEGEVPEMSSLAPPDRTLWDYQIQGVTSGVHPMLHYRPQLKALKLKTLGELNYYQPGMWVQTAGVVVARQRPPTAKGFCFIELEDETGLLQVAAPPKVYERYARELRSSGLVLAGKLEGVGAHRSILGYHFRPLAEVLGQPHVGGYSSHPGQMAH
jgi:error-prone DNA polymerase